ncbi:helix-turn-helix transcriptional regulator [Nocardioides sp. GXQ0305]|uniref:helix-turn-helix transcriptional regulator n=1 Tax=Nocardioides sp. GXQ0305 TaxID=3423912 RepID=UPI003D7C6480
MSSSDPPSSAVSPVDRGTGGGAVASGKSPNPGVEPVGRGAELRQLAGLLDAARAGNGGVLLLQGEPGIGKTTLLDAARGMASGFRVLGAQGVETESVLPHAGLVQLLGPLRELAGRLPPGQGEALGRALGWSAERGPVDRFLVAAATLSLLAEAAEKSPLLVVVDDLMWVDPESASALLFAVRRLDQDRVAVVLASRPLTPVSGLVEGLPTLSLAGLDEDGSRHLLGSAVTAAVARRLHAASGGNPLALLEVARRMSAAQAGGGAGLPDPLPVGDRLGAALDRTLASLSPAAARGVLLAAVHPAEADAVVSSALTAEGLDAGAAVDEAVDREVLREESGGGHGFRHPLLRAAAVRRASAGERRSAHRALAAASPAADDPVALWHLAHAADRPDENLAGRLAALATDSRSRTGHASASAALERAAWLTPDPGQAASRRAAAARDAFVGGDMVRTRRLAAAVLDDRLAPREARAVAGLAQGMLEQYAGSVPAAATLLAEAVDCSDGAARVPALTELALTSFRLGDMEAFHACATRIAEAADGSRADQRLARDFTTGVSLLLHDQREAGQALLRSVVEQSADLTVSEVPHAALLLAMAAGFLGDPRPAMETGLRLLAELRARGEVGVLVSTLAIVAAGRAWLGDHVGAFADAGEAVELGTHLGYVADVSVAEETLAWQLAARGRHEEAAEALVRARALTDRAGTTAVAAHQALTAAYCALCRGDVAAVVAELEPRLDLDGGVGAMGEPLGVAPMLVEAYVALGRGEDALDLARRLETATSPDAPAHQRAPVLRTLALAAVDDDEALATYGAALAAHAEAPELFETAHTTLLLGSRLRRAGRRVEARERLRQAREAFAAMDLSLWVERSDAELAATGTTRTPAAAVGDALTSQEARVARLVAEGLTNREVAAALFLSPKTVEHHLSSVFRKRGLRSRGELIRAFARVPGNGGEHS